MKALSFFKTLENIYSATQHDIPEDWNHQQHCWENRNLTHDTYYALYVSVHMVRLRGQI
jgi:hypothetical protein